MCIQGPLKWFAPRPVQAKFISRALSPKEGSEIYDCVSEPHSIARLGLCAGATRCVSMLGRDF